MNDQEAENQERGPHEQKGDPGSTEPVWTYRGYEIRPSEFNTAMVHLYRGELTRANTWRKRLDATTNWAVVTTGATISIAFSQSKGHHSVILLNILLVSLFLFIEARRYRYYELWSSRIRLLETDFYAGMLVPPFRPSWDWAENLAENLLQPSFPISMWEAFGRRFRRNYLWIYVIVASSWIAKLWLHPQKATSWEQLVNRATFMGVSGETIFLIIGVLLGGLMLIGFFTRPLQEASGEVLPQAEDIAREEEIPSEGEEDDGMLAWFRPEGKRKQVLMHIVTTNPKQISEKILQQMNRGVTKVEATGMYTGKDRSVLMCAVTVTEFSQIKSLIKEEDPDAFIILVPARGVMGEGFEPLEK